MDPDKGEAIPGYGKEVSSSLRQVRQACGWDIEKKLALRKLDLIQNAKDAPELADDSFLEGVINTRKVMFKGVAEDFSVAGKESVVKLDERTSELIRDDYQNTVSAYQEMSDCEGADLTKVARNEKEEAVILEAAKLLGYKVKEIDERGIKEKKFYPPEKFKTGGDLEQVLRTRINVGIKNLLKDYMADLNSIEDTNRPLLRTIVAMVDSEAKVFRSPARMIG